MRKWGVIITVFYTVALVIFWALLLGKYIWDWYGWFIIILMVSAQALLLFLSVDRKFRHTKPRSHVIVSIITASFLFGLLTIALLGTLVAVIAGDKAGYPPLWYFVLAAPIIIWVIWAVLFYVYYRDTSGDIARVVTWLLRGSVLELLVAVPSHLIVRGRNECSAPIMTSFGIVTGIVIMLLAFGPSVLLLYKKRIDERLKKSG